MAELLLGQVHSLFFFLNIAVVFFYNYIYNWFLVSVFEQLKLICLFLFLSHFSLVRVEWTSSWRLLR
jgi:hypothetical protein